MAYERTTRMSDIPSLAILRSVVMNLSAGETEFNILDCHVCLSCFDSSDRPYDISVEWQDEQGRQEIVMDKLTR